MKISKCEICGKSFKADDFSEIGMCGECDELYHLGQSDFGLETDDCTSN